MIPLVFGLGKPRRAQGMFVFSSGTFGIWLLKPFWVFRGSAFGARTMEFWDRLL